MELVSIFDSHLTAFRYEPGQPDEFSRIFTLWQDPQYLYSFFQENLTDLQSGVFGDFSILDAVWLTCEEAKRLERKLLVLANSLPVDLDSAFRLLRRDESFELGRTKAKGDSRVSWLRVYAIKIEPNVYSVTGGAIKLTRAMQDRAHTKHELSKFDRCIAYLREQGINNIDGISELLS